MNGLAPQDCGEIGFLQRPLWASALAALVALQGATTLTLFSSERSWQPLLDERPILNGRHPLHLYHGLLGAQSWRERNFGSAYDPAFQAGYPKTPCFDSGSRPAELFLLLGHDRLHAYKLGLAASCLLVPLVYASAGRLIGVGPGASCLAALLGQLVWWGPPLQRLLAEGDLDWLLAGLCLTLHTALLVRFHRDGGLGVWVGMLLTCALAWFCHPVLALGFSLLVVPFFVFVALRHGLMWNLGLLSSCAGGVLINHGWLEDWLRWCWLYRPLPFSPAAGIHASLSSWWQLANGAGRVERLGATILLTGGLLGILGLLARKRISAGLMFGSTLLFLPALSFGSAIWEPLQIVGTQKLLILACAIATIPAASGVADLFALLRRLTPRSRAGVAFGAAALIIAAVPCRDELEALVRPALNARSLTLGFNSEQQALAKALHAATKPDGRILLEERPGHPTPCWTALLPKQTQRPFLGGLVPDSGIEHLHARLSGTVLAGRPLAEWTDSELQQFCERYNVSYVVCWTPEVTARFRAWPAVQPVVPIQERGPGWLFAIKRTPSFVLKGKARVIQMDAQRIALADLEPEDGVVLLSLHYQEGFHIFPDTVRAERAPDPDDPIPFLRLRLPGPVARLTLTWEE
jgi:hypothetical protein